VDGFLAHTFSPQDSHAFFALLLRTPDFLRYYRISYSQGVWYITQNVPHVQRSPPGVPSQNPPPALDFSVKGTQGTVVPQRRWIPADEEDVRRHVTQATLQLPIFFVNRNGGVGFGLPDILQGRDYDLYNRDSEASLGGVATTHIRINVSPPYIILAVTIPHLRSSTPPTVARLQELEAPGPHTRRDLWTESNHSWSFHEARCHFP